MADDGNVRLVALRAAVSETGVLRDGFRRCGSQGCIIGTGFGRCGSRGCSIGNTNTSLRLMPSYRFRCWGIAATRHLFRFLFPLYCKIIRLIFNTNTILLLAGTCFS